MNTPTGHKIYIIYYKKGTIIKHDDFYQPLMSGNYYAHETHPPFLGDDTGDNISDKNPFYSELTGIYWLWKNTDNPVTGVCHYRRFYTAKPEPLSYRVLRMLYSFIGLGRQRHGLIYTKDINLFRSKILSEEELTALLNQYDAILPQARKLKYSVKEHYSRYHESKDLEILEGILQEKYPEYLEAFAAVLAGNRLYANNMFVLKDPEYRKFMSWWFDMIFEFENRAGLEHYSGYQKRIIGFIAERLLTVWFRKEQLNCKELPLIYFKSLKNE